MVRLWNVQIFYDRSVCPLGEMQHLFFFLYSTPMGMMIKRGAQWGCNSNRSNCSDNLALLLSGQLRWCLKRGGGGVREEEKWSSNWIWRAWLFKMFWKDVSVNVNRSVNILPNGENPPSWATVDESRIFSRCTTQEPVSLEPWHWDIAIDVLMNERWIHRSRLPQVISDQWSLWMD